MVRIFGQGKRLGKFSVGMVCVLSLLVVAHESAAGWLGVDGYFLLLFAVLIIGTRLGLYVYRKDRGRSDPLDKSRWWDSL